MAALPAAYLLAAVGLSCLHSRARIAILALIVCAWVPSILSIYHEPRSLVLPMRKIARAASNESRRDGLILVHSDSFRRAQYRTICRWPCRDRFVGGTA